MLAQAYWGLRWLFESVLKVIVAVLIIGLAVLVLVAVYLRYTGSPLHFYDELASIMLAWLTYYGAALAALNGGHIAFPGLVNKMPPALRIPVVIFAQVFIIGFFVVLAYYGLWVLDIIAGDRLISLRWFPQALAQHVIPVGAILYIAAELLRTPDLIRFATNPNEKLVDEH